MAVLVTVSAALSGASGAAPADVLDIGNQRQVFIDGRFMAKSKDVKLVVHPPVKTGEATIKADRPWERGVGVYDCVLEDKGTYHMWYESGRGICYAVSLDGIHWVKPSLGLADYKGDKQNNIVIGYGAAGVKKFGEFGMVFIDPTAPPDQRFRLNLREHEPNVIKPESPSDINVFSSPDGIHWRMTHQHVLTFREPDKRQHLDTQNLLFWDERIQKYVSYMRRNVRKNGGPRFRTVVRTESPKIGGFEQAQLAPIILAPDEHDARFGVADQVDYYTSGVIKYPWAQDAYFMFPTAYFHYIAGVLSEFPKQVPANSGPLDTQFAASRDGVKWERYDRRPFISLGMKSDFDSKTARCLYGMVPSRDGNEIYMYYAGGDHLHGWPGRKHVKDAKEKEAEEEVDADEEPVDPEQKKKDEERSERSRKLLIEAGLAPTLDTHMISRLVLRRDGFVSAQAGLLEGEFSTGPLKFSGRELVLNINTSATGYLQCELLDENDRPIEGHALTDSDVIHTANEINRVVSWKRQKDLSALAGKTIKIRFVFRNADVYAFQFR